MLALPIFNETLLRVLGASPVELSFQCADWPSIAVVTCVGPGADAEREVIALVIDSEDSGGSACNDAEPLEFVEQEDSGRAGFLDWLCIDWPWISTAAFWLALADTSLAGISCDSDRGRKAGRKAGRAAIRSSCA